MPPFRVCLLPSRSFLILFWGGAYGILKAIFWVNMSQNDSILSPSLSEEYTDLIYRYQEPSGQTLAQLAAYSPQPVNSQYVILHIPSPEGLSNVSASGYASVPKLFTFLNTDYCIFKSIVGEKNVIAYFFFAFIGI